LLSTGIPDTFRAARQSPEWPEWKGAIDVKLGKMAQYRVWKEVPCTEGMRTLKAKWVFTRKVDGETGKPSAYKARWVAKGYSQIAGVDYNKLYAGVAHKDSVRVFLLLVNHYNLECDQVDIRAAFLNGVLKETIHLEAPEGSNIPHNTVLKLEKTLYGLKQAPHDFNREIDLWFKSQGIELTQADVCIYRRVSKDSVRLISIHVDDQLIACNSRSELDEFKAKFNARFECSDGGPVNYFLGFNVFRDRQQRKLWVSQKHYVESVLERFEMDQAKPNKAPLPSGYRPVMATDKEHALAKHEEYPAMVGSLMYAATINRPDIAQAVGLLARTATKWNMEHVDAAKHLL
jgi:hypothetical protein